MANEYEVVEVETGEVVAEATARSHQHAAEMYGESIRSSDYYPDADSYECAARRGDAWLDVQVFGGGERRMYRLRWLGWMDSASLDSDDELAGL